MSRAAGILGVGIAASFLVLHLLGLRESVSMLSGTVTGSASEAAGGMLYALTFFGAVLVAPVLVVSAGLHWLGSWWLARRRGERSGLG